MRTSRKPVTNLYVDKSGHQWIVRDPDGQFWIVPPGDNPWDNRQPFFPTEETVLEPVPSHYRCVLGLPI